MTELYQAVCYTDGGCKNDSIGWGVHGYLHTHELILPPSKPVRTDVWSVTDLGYKLNTDTTDIRYVQPTIYIDGYGSSILAGTNNIAEITAVIQALTYLQQYHLTSILILTDSEYVKRGVTEWLDRWHTNQYTRPDGSKISNIGPWQQLYALIQQWTDRGVAVVVRWVKAHANILGNIQADALASIGVNHSANGSDVSSFVVTDQRGYWKSDIDRHPMLNFKRVYFNSLAEHNVLGEYYQAEPGGVDLIVGKRIPETGYSVVRLDEPDVVLEAIKQRQITINQGVNAIYVMKLDRVYDKNVHPYIHKYQTYALNRANRNNNINFLDQTPITTEINPTGLSLRAIEGFQYLEEMLDNWVAGTVPHTVDITELFFDITERTVKGTTTQIFTLKSEYIVGYRDLTAEIKLPDSTALKVPLILGVDLPPRNNLKRLEGLKPSVHILTWSESPKTLRYACIVKCDNAIGIWSNYFADRMFL